MINRVILVGRLTKDPILKKVPSGDSVAEFTLAVNRKYETQQADYIKCIVWRKMAENVYKYCSKGSTVGIEGKLQSRSYDNSHGQKVFVLEAVCESVQFLDSRNKENKAPEQQNSFNGSNNNFDISEDDIQF